MKTYRKPNKSNKKLFISLGILWGIILLIISFIAFFQTPIYPKVRTYMERSEHEQYVITLVNRERAKHHVAPVTENMLLDKSAKLKGEDMITNHYYAHTSPQNVAYYVFPRKVDYSWVAFGEDLGENFTNDDRLFAAWMNSPKHKEVILDPDYTEAGYAKVGRYSILHLGER